ncbi:MAG: 4Fe-4S dicluster domain-containing protein [Ignavibacteria bacterium]|nr:4Fe-4S dicluster domain-containing protein [Ignavibacteria bacterium]
MEEKRKYRIDVNTLQLLFDELKRREYTLIGPTLRDFAIVYDEIESVKDMPKGKTDTQSPGKYSLEDTNDDSLFSYVVGPRSPKFFLHPPELRYFRAEKDGRSFRVNTDEAFEKKYAFIGLRACEIEAIKMQDKVLLESQFKDSHYEERRNENFIIAVNCSKPAGNCFCTSMGTGPKVKENFDLSLTEILENSSHYFVLEVGSEIGSEIVNNLRLKLAEDKEIIAGEEVTRKAIEQITKKLQTEGLKELLQENFEHPNWDEVALRCLNCGNCTMVCPTCFCVNVEDITDLSGDNTERWRKWDSCFTSDFSYIHGGSIRQSSKSRYRQWISHKLANWVDQFGSFGCVGCGRCITWCPVGIDITEEVYKIKSNQLVNSETNNMEK